MASAIACMPAIAFAARLLAARLQAGPRRVGRRQQRAEQRQAAHQLRRGGREMERHDRAHRMGDHMRALDMQGGSRPAASPARSDRSRADLRPVPIVRSRADPAARRDGASRSASAASRRSKCRPARESAARRRPIRRSRRRSARRTAWPCGAPQATDRRRARPANSGSLANRPSFMTASSRFWSCSTVMLATGSPSTSSRSAR